MRTRGKFHHLEELKGVGVWINRAAPFLLVDGRRKASAQLDLFAEAHPPGANIRTAGSVMIPIQYQGNSF
jgi:hypothetical protein